jgi:hypothetical protein
MTSQQPVPAIQPEVFEPLSMDELFPVANPEATRAAIGANRYVTADGKTWGYLNSHGQSTWNRVVGDEQPGITDRRVRLLEALVAYSYITPAVEIRRRQAAEHIADLNRFIAEDPSSIMLLVVPKRHADEGWLDPHVRGFARLDRILSVDEDTEGPSIQPLLAGQAGKLGLLPLNLNPKLTDESLIKSEVAGLYMERIEPPVE